MQQSTIWWKEGVIYQVYPRSFQDSNGDGIGDLPGIIQRVPHLHNLGVDIIWLSPVYMSPNDDNGYDISDYYAIHPEFGTMADLEALLEALHSRGMRLVMDLVVNHTSDEHAWFQQARQSRDNPYRDYYIWRDGTADVYPNNWRSYFSGPAWEWDEQSEAWYLHLFTRKQADLNWDNPTVRQEIYRMMRFWLDKGVDGFRMDVISLISKPEGLPDKDWDTLQSDYGTAYANGPRVHEYLQEMHREVMAQYDVMTIGEGVGITPEQANLYVGADRDELNMIFHFGHMPLDFGPGGRFDPVPYSVETFKQIFIDWDRGVGNSGWNSLYLGNHDFPRMLSRFGDEDFHEVSAKCLATLLFTLRGTPVIYQGDEIGMTNCPFSSIEEHRDVETLNAYREWLAEGKNPAAFIEAARDQARDHARTPVQWSAAEAAGFSTGQPWIKVNPNYSAIHAASQADVADSILNFYRQLVALRKTHKTLVYGETDFHTGGPSALMAYSRRDASGRYRVLLNLSASPIQIDESLSEGKLLLQNYPGTATAANHMEPWEARVLSIYSD